MAQYCQTPDQKPPPRLFKYVPPERIDILETERISFTPPQRFNDPFDLHPTVPVIDSKTYIRKYTPRIKKEAGATAKGIAALNELILEQYYKKPELLAARL